MYIYIIYRHSPLLLLYNIYSSTVRYIACYVSDFTFDIRQVQFSVLLFLRTWIKFAVIIYRCI